MPAVPTLHLLKLCVGAARVEDLRDWQAARSAEARAAGADPRPVCVTRMWPRRTDALLAGGSLYWVFKGLVLARQRIEGLEPCDLGDGVERCAIRLDPALTPTEPRPRRPFQGWRYLPGPEAPRDLPRDAVAAGLPPALALALAELGVADRRAGRG